MRDWIDIFKDFASSLKFEWKDTISDWIEGTKTWETFWTEMWEGFKKTALETLVDIVTDYMWKELLEQITDVGKKMRQSGESGAGGFDLILVAVTSVFGGIVLLTKKVLDFVLGLFGVKPKPLDDVKEAADKAKGALSEAETAAEEAKKAIDKVDEAPVDEVTAATEAAKEKFNELMSAAQSTVGSISQGFALLAMNISNNMSNAVAGIISDLDSIPDVTSLLVEYTERNWATVWNHYNSLVDKTITVTTRYTSTGSSGFVASAQIGIPYIPRTMPVVVHKKEAILTAPQAEAWRAGRGATGGGTQVTYERGAIRMTVMGSINQQVDLEEAMDYLAKKQTEKMRRP